MESGPAEQTHQMGDNIQGSPGLLGGRGLKARYPSRSEVIVQREKQLLAVLSAAPVTLKP